MRLKTLEQNSAQDFAGLQIDLLSKMRDGNIPYDQLKWFTNLSFDARKALRAIEEMYNLKREDVLKPINESEKITISACSGEKTFWNSRNLLKVVHPDFDDHDLTEKSQPKEETEIEVCGIIKDVTVEFLLKFFSDDIHELSLTQHQILTFIAENPTLFNDTARRIFFLCKCDGEYAAKGLGKFYIVQISSPQEGVYEVPQPKPLSEIIDMHVASKDMPRIAIPRI